jgi:uncharacterized protein DUF2461
VRFSADRTPHKEHQGGFIQTEPGIGWYAQVSADGLRVAGGSTVMRRTGSRGTGPRGYDADHPRIEWLTDHVGPAA